MLMRTCLGDSLTFDPSPFADSIDLEFHYGVHALPHAKNDSDRSRCDRRPAIGEAQRVHREETPI
jgi:hypothetical protein